MALGGQATSCDSDKATISPTRARHPLAHDPRQPFFVTLANDRCGTSRAGSFLPGHETRLRSGSLVRTAVASLPAHPQRLVALRHIVPASSRSLRRANPPAVKGVGSWIVDFSKPEHRDEEEIQIFWIPRLPIPFSAFPAAKK